MTPFLYIPWFRLEQWDVPLIQALGGLVVLCLAFAAIKRYREQAISTLAVAVVAGAAAYFLFDFDTVPVQPFGILVAIGVLSASRLAEWQGQQWGVHPAVVADFTTHIAVIGLVSCYFLNGLFYETDTLLEILANPTLLFSRWLGLSSFGGFIGAIFALFIWKKRRGLPALPLADIVCWSFPMAWIFGRLGCFVVHDHPGDITTFFMGVENWGGQEGVIRHDLGLYEVFWSIAVMALFFKLRHRQNRPTGFFVGLLPLLYTPYRFGLDFLRAQDVHNPDVRFGGFTPGHYAAIGFFIFSVLWMLKFKDAPEIEIPEKMRWNGEGVNEEDDSSQTEDALEEDDSEDSSEEEAPKASRTPKRGSKKKKKK